MATARDSEPGILGTSKTRDTPPLEMPEGDTETAGFSESPRPFTYNYDESEATGEPPYWATWGF
jgi:hypothetical protein